MEHYDPIQKINQFKKEKSNQNKMIRGSMRSFCLGPAFKGRAFGYTYLSHINLYPTT